jgi:hypothetical protein
MSGLLWTVKPHQNASLMLVQVQAGINADDVQRRVLLKPSVKQHRRRPLFQYRVPLPSWPRPAAVAATPSLLPMAHASKHRVLHRWSGSPASLWDGSPRRSRLVRWSVSRTQDAAPGIGLDFVPRSPLYSIQIPAKVASGRSSSSPNQTMSFFLVSGFGSGAYSAKLLNGTRQRFSGLSQPRQCGENVLRRRPWTPQSDACAARGARCRAARHRPA